MLSCASQFCSSSFRYLSSARPDTAMAKSLRSKWRRKMRAIKRIRYGVKELDRLKKMLVNAGEIEVKEGGEIEHVCLGNSSLFTRRHPLPLQSITIHCPIPCHQHRTATASTQDVIYVLFLVVPYIVVVLQLCLVLFKLNVYRKILYFAV